MKSVFLKTQLLQARIIKWAGSSEPSAGKVCELQMSWNHIPISSCIWYIMISLHLFFLGPIFYFLKRYFFIILFKSCNNMLSCLPRVLRSGGNNMFICRMFFKMLTGFRMKRSEWVSQRVALKACGNSRDLKDAIFNKEMDQVLKPFANVWTPRVLQLSSPVSKPLKSGRVLSTQAIHLCFTLTMLFKSTELKSSIMKMEKQATLNCPFYISFF